MEKRGEKWKDLLNLNRIEEADKDAEFEVSWEFCIFLLL